VVYSLPESKRGLRHALRGQLVWLGFGPLAPAPSSSPRDRRADLEDVCAELGLSEHVEIFSGMHRRSENDHALVERCWDLPALAAEYRQFIARYEDEYTEYRALATDRLWQLADVCFARRFWLTHAFLPFPRKDPNLPIALLPPGWAGLGARRLFDQYRGLLEPYADQFVDAAMCGETLAEKVEF
jgi:phenylacetic acid degradation operon negative regulatory protein